MDGNAGLERRLEVREHAQLFERHRPRLYGLAYRMLGSFSDAEDVVQEAYLRWHGADSAAIGSPEAWLVTTTTRLALDRLRRAAAERRAYTGPWLPEPWPGALFDPGEPVDAASPDRRLERVADLSMAFLVLLERLTPLERAAFVLREVFAVEFAEIARALEKSEAACRQLVHRARARVRQGAPRFVADQDELRRLLERFIRAIRADDERELLALLAPDAALVSDGGGKVRAARNVIQRADRVARFLLGVARKRAGRFEDRIAIINGEPGVVRRLDGEINATMSIALGPQGIGPVYVVLNPDKLRRIAGGMASAPAPDGTERHRTALARQPCVRAWLVMSQPAGPDRLGSGTRTSSAHRHEERSCNPDCTRCGPPPMRSTPWRH